MRPIHQHDLDDWLRLRPITQSLKTARYKLLNWAYLAKTAPGLEAFLRTWPALGQGPLAFSIAFNQPAMIEWQIRFAQRNLEDATLVIADNSNNEAAAAEIRALCAAAGIPYLKLPVNRTSHVMRSHALSLNWIHRHLVRRLRPPIFAFLDHDLVPVHPTSLRKLLGDQPFYGALRDQPFYGHKQDRTQGWYLWAGYCVFSFAQTESRHFDFQPDWFIGLDTGGANWWTIFRYYDKASLRFARCHDEAFVDPGDGKHKELEWIDGWLHAGKASLYSPSGTDYRGVFVNALKRKWAELHEPARAGTGNA